MRRLRHLDQRPPAPSIHGRYAKAPWLTAEEVAVAQVPTRGGHDRNEKLWTVAQAISEVLPHGGKEKKLLRALLNQRDRAEEPAKTGELFS